MLEDLREIMNFGPRAPIKRKTISKERFRRLYQKRMREGQKPAELRNEVMFLKLFGLVPEDFDYEKTVLDLLSEQAWALYDYKRRTMFLSDWAPPEAREYAILHELVHAVDDQQFNLRRFVKGARESEQQLARLAVVEGQASWVMTEWVMRQSDRSLRGNRLLAIATVSSTRFEAEQFPVYGSTPLYFREVLIFPYTDGLLFQHDKAFAEIDKVCVYSLDVLGDIGQSCFDGVDLGGVGKIERAPVPDGQHEQCQQEADDGAADG